MQKPNDSWIRMVVFGSVLGYTVFMVAVAAVAVYGILKLFGVF